MKGALSGGNWKYYDYESTPSDGISWQLPLSREDFTSSHLWKEITKRIPAQHGGVTEHVDLRARIMRRGDNVRITENCKEGESGWSFTLFLSKLADKNDYGEVLFFDKDLVIATIQPQQYALLTWSCRIPYQFQYPSISTGYGQVFIHGVIYDKVDVIPTYLSHTVKEFPKFGGRNSLPDGFNASQHIVSLTHTPLQRPIYILDDLFPEQMLVDLRKHIYHSSHYFYDDSDDQGDTDNVQWISGYRSHQFVQSAFWNTINQTLAQITGHSGWYPYDVSCNLNRAWDHTRIHKDCYDKDEYTFLLYLNPEIKPGDLGGTVWYDHEDLSHIVTSVMNKFGRVALFHCEIKHSARPPHAYATFARYTFAVKVARSKLDAVSREMGTYVSGLLHMLEDEDSAKNWVDELTVKHNYDADKLESEFIELQKRGSKTASDQLLAALRNAGSENDF